MMVLIFRGAAQVEERPIAVEMTKLMVGHLSSTRELEKRRALDLGM
jgi:hypothetical protein